MHRLAESKLLAGFIYGDPHMQEYIYLPASELDAASPMLVYETGKERPIGIPSHKGVRKREQHLPVRIRRMAVRIRHARKPAQRNPLQTRPNMSPWASILSGPLPCPHHRPALHDDYAIPCKLIKLAVAIGRPHFECMLVCHLFFP